VDAPLAPQAFVGVCASSTHWHSRLGHPASPGCESCAAST
jgi:hypothetical protein